MSNAADALFRKAYTEQQAGRLDVAVSTYTQALALEPAHADARHFRGLALLQLGRVSDGMADLKRSVELSPHNAGFHGNLGTAYRQAGRSDEAFTHLAEAVRLDPLRAEALSSLGALYRERGETAAAIECLRRAIAVNPRLAAAHFNLGNAFLSASRLSDAIAAFKAALELSPNHAKAWTNLGKVYKDAGQLDSAKMCYRRAIALAPHDPLPGSNLLMTLLVDPSVSPAEVFKEHLRWAARHDSVSRQPVWQNRPLNPNASRRLRIGYISADTRTHVMGWMMHRWMPLHDRGQFDIAMFSSASSFDGTSELIRTSVDHWHDISTANDDQAAEMIADAGIDILVDLSSHMGGNRLGVLTRQPAPVQASYLAYPHTTGLSSIRYLVTDRFLHPPEPAGATDDGHSEQLARLDGCYWPYQPPTDVSDLPARDLKREVRFGTLCTFSKINVPTLRVWKRILDAVPGSRLVLLAPGSESDAPLVRQMADEAGLDFARIILRPKGPREEYIRHWLEIDIGLDPFPYGGHTTMLDALWMGVPVVTLAGRTGISRGGVSCLTMVGLPELIAADVDAYVAIAVQFAGDRSRVALLASSLRSKMQASPALDASAHARDLERLYRQWWIDFCRSA